MRSDRPSVAVLALGGTIASPATPDGRATPTLDADALVQGLGDDIGLDIRSETVGMLPSPELTFAHLRSLLDRMQALLDDGCSGFVVTQGTDSLEETAFSLDLLWHARAPVVVTGAMRNPGVPGADGAANLLGALRVAASPLTRGLGCLVVMSDEIHAARSVRKTHASSPGAFASWPGALGWVVEGRVRVAMTPVERRRCIPAVDAPGVEPRVAVVTAYSGDDGRLLRLAGSAYEGIVVEALGGGHLPAEMAAVARRLAQSLPVVLASRTGTGETLRGTYGFEGSETDLLRAGLIPAGALDGPKSRVLLALLLAAGIRKDDIAGWFEDVGSPVR